MAHPSQMAAGMDRGAVAGAVTAVFAPPLGSGASTTRQRTPRSAAFCRLSLPQPPLPNSPWLRFPLEGEGLLLDFLALSLLIPLVQTLRGLAMGGETRVDPRRA